jgi:hypothetical protein
VFEPKRALSVLVVPIQEASDMDIAMSFLLASNWGNNTALKDMLIPTGITIQCAIEQMAICNKKRSY